MEVDHFIDPQILFQTLMFLNTTPRRSIQIEEISPDSRVQGKTKI
jgi:hypothetical protein